MSEAEKSFLCKKVGVFCFTKLGRTAEAIEKETGLGSVHGQVADDLFEVALRWHSGCGWRGACAQFPSSYLLFDAPCGRVARPLTGANWI